MIRQIIETFRQAYKIAATKLADDADIAERVAIAKAFNDRYTYRFRWDPDRAKSTADRNAWMCPDCNRIHRSTYVDQISGARYPECCSTGAGSRLPTRYKD